MMTWMTLKHSKSSSSVLAFDNVMLFDGIKFWQGESSNLYRIIFFFFTIFLISGLLKYVFTYA